MNTQTGHVVADRNELPSQSPLAHFARARNEAAIAKRARRAAKRLGNS
jgi:hypothetical protein